jgi:hypothetical protein
MTDQHRATPKQWAAQEAWADDYDSSCILELRDRVEQLEAQYETQRLATLEWGKDVDQLQRWADVHLKRIMALEAGQKIRSGPESPLVERVADAIAAEATSAGIVNDRPARAAIREVAAWIDERDLQIQNEPDACDPPTADDAVRWLRDEANQ